MSFEGSYCSTHCMDEAIYALGFEDPREGGIPIMQRNLCDLRKDPAPHPTHHVPTCSLSSSQGKASSWWAAGAWTLLWLNGPFGQIS